VSRTRTSVRRAASQSRKSQKKSQARRQALAKRRKKDTRRRGAGVIALTVLVGLAAGYAIVNRDELIDKVREVTLPLRHEDVIRQQAREKDVPADLIAAVIWQESKFRDQTSSAGARGLMQITPATADEIEKLSGGSSFEYEDLADPDLNIRYGTFYLRHLLDIYEDDVVAALAAYNAGPGNAEAWGGADLEIEDIEFQETRDYVESVLEKRDQYRDNYAEELGL
jgi:soluble lytic murein transglycosylase